MQRILLNKEIIKIKIYKKIINNNKSIKEILQNLYTTDNTY